MGSSEQGEEATRAGQAEGNGWPSIFRNKADAAASPREVGVKIDHSVYINADVEGLVEESVTPLKETGYVPGLGFGSQDGARLVKDTLADRVREPYVQLARLLLTLHYEHHPGGVDSLFECGATSCRDALDCLYQGPYIHVGTFEFGSG